MKIKISRLNLDSSWRFVLDGIPFIVDPWLIGSEVDGFSWLNEQWHIKEPVAPSELLPYDFILITQSYEDHCHLDTLKLLPQSRPILATQKAFQRLRRKLPNRKVHLIPNEGEFLWQGLKFRAFKPKKRIDPIYFAIDIERGGQSVFYAPHGFTLSDRQLARLENVDCRLLMTTFTDFRLPAILGGHVNPGEQNVYHLFEQLDPDNVVNTHDEQKQMKGLVARTAKVRYPDFKTLESRGSLPFVSVPDYSEVSI